MRLRDIYDKLVKFNHERFDLAEDYVSQACKELIPLLLKLKDYNEVAVNEYNDAWYVDLRFIHKYLAIRYCGRFVNGILIEKDGWCEEEYSKISLRYLYIESESEYNRFPDDQYKKDSSDTFGIQSCDYKKFSDFIYSLIPFFKGGVHEDEYMQFWKSQGEKTKELRKLDDRIADEINNDLDCVLHEIFNGYFKNRNIKKRFLMLPYDVSIRYRGKFHNCIIEDNYSMSLGYVKNLTHMSEDEYNQDPYTIDFDATRYPDNVHVLIHETSLIATESNGYNLQFAIKTLLALCEHELENGELESLSGLDVEHVKTILTD
ncbi:MAG: hypothetical protein IJ504_01215 [Bacteroidales bacterium]|nr:hypothetical protein [Bacteroidales bacterium]